MSNQKKKIIFPCIVLKTYKKNYTYISVSVPPEDPVVLDGWGRPLNSSTIGPKEEGDDVTLTCRVIGGMNIKCFFFLHFCKCYFCFWYLHVIVVC